MKWIVNLIMYAVGVVGIGMLIYAVVEHCGKPYQEMIIAFMWEKDRLIKESWPEDVPQVNYMTKDDAVNIRKWWWITSRSVWRRLKKHVHWGVSGLGRASCPPCIRIDKRLGSEICLGCDYAKVHAQCGALGSTWKDIIAHILTGEVLSNDVYTQMIQDVEKDCLAKWRNS